MIDRDTVQVSKGRNGRPTFLTHSLSLPSLFFVCFPLFFSLSFRPSGQSNLFFLEPSISTYLILTAYPTVRTFAISPYCKTVPA